MHWVGDGFPVRSLFSYQTHGKTLSPFLLLDYAGPLRFNPAQQPRGVGIHPHRGFETVTLVYQGEVAHRDSTGRGGIIGPGDVQWMTAASGILHEEFHSPAFTATGGEMEMVQLWVNLPAKDKMHAPGYQNILAQDIPQVTLAGDVGFLRVIAGSYEGRGGPAHTFSPLLVWDLRLRAGGESTLPLPEGWNAALVILHGDLQVDNGQVAHSSNLVVLSATGESVQVSAPEGAVVLVLAGMPIDEPIVGLGPFVMNTQAEIHRAFDDFNSGRFGAIA